MWAPSFTASSLLSAPRAIAARRNPIWRAHWIPRQSQPGDGTSSLPSGIRIPTENSINWSPKTERFRFFGTQNSYYQQIKIRMKTRIDFVLRLALVLTVIGATLTMAQQFPAGGVVPSHRPQGSC